MSFAFQDFYFYHGKIIKLSSDVDRQYKILTLRKQKRTFQNVWVIT